MDPFHRWSMRPKTLYEAISILQWPHVSARYHHHGWVERWSFSVDDLWANHWLNPINERLLCSGATAGLRLINLTNPTYITALLGSTRAYFQSLGLLFRSPENQVRIISGSEEGLSGWITTNILMHQLYENNQPMDTYGILDMGGSWRARTSTDDGKMIIV